MGHFEVVPAGVAATAAKLSAVGDAVLANAGGTEVHLSAEATVIPSLAAAVNSLGPEIRGNIEQRARGIEEFASLVGRGSETYVVTDGGVAASYNGIG